VDIGDGQHAREPEPAFKGEFKPGIIERRIRASISSIAG
jgi:hypothetical protein